MLVPTRVSALAQESRLALYTQLDKYQEHRLEFRLQYSYPLLSLTSTTSSAFSPLSRWRVVYSQVSRLWFM